MARLVLAGQRYAGGDQNGKQAVKDIQAKVNISGPWRQGCPRTPLEFASIGREGAQPYLTGCTGLGQP